MVKRIMDKTFMDVRLASTQLAKWIVFAQLRRSLSISWFESRTEALGAGACCAPCAPPDDDDDALAGAAALDEAVAEAPGRSMGSARPAGRLAVPNKGKPPTVSYMFDVTPMYIDINKSTDPNF